MQKAVLIRSSKEGESPWVSTQGCKRLCVQGLEHLDRLEVSLGPSMERIEVNRNGEHSILDGAERVKVYHPCENPASCVTVMLEG